MRNEGRGQAHRSHGEEELLGEWLGRDDGRSVVNCGEAPLSAPEKSHHREPQCSERSAAGDDNSTRSATHHARLVMSRRAHYARSQRLVGPVARG